MSLLGIISDAHGNIEAFDHCVRILEDLGTQEFVFLGDAIGYIPSVEVVRRLWAMQSRVRCIRGNHEALLLAGDLDTERDHVYQLGSVRNMLRSEEVDFLSAWPETLEINAGRFRIRFVHGSPTDPTYGYVYPDTDLTPFGAPADYVFMGNSHHAFVRRSLGCCYVNVGSCGLPRDDGALGAAATFDCESGAVEIYRFDIGPMNERLKRGSAPLHPSVIAVMSRRNERAYGTRI